MNWKSLKTTVWSLIVVGGASVVAACGGPSSVSPGVSPELKHSWEVNFNRGDVAAVVALYAPDADLVMSGSETAKGTAAIQSVVEAMIKSGAKVHIGASQNVGAGDIAYVYGTYTVLDRGGGAETERGSYVEVWRRLDGVWKITLDVNAAGPAVSSAPAAPVEPLAPVAPVAPK